MLAKSSKLLSLFLLAASAVAAPAPQGLETFPTVIQGTTTVIQTRSSNLSRSTRVAATTMTSTVPIISLITTSVSGSNSVITSTVGVGASSSDGVTVTAEPVSSIAISSGVATELPTLTTPTISSSTPAATTSTNSGAARTLGGYGVAAVAGVAGLVAAVL